jgi:hypothetical protein
MNITDSGLLRTQNAIIARLQEAGLKLNILKAKYTCKDALQSHHHTCNHGGGYGKAARRNGWHGNGSSRVTARGMRIFERTGSLSGSKRAKVAAGSE